METIYKVKHYNNIESRETFSLYFDKETLIKYLQKRIDEGLNLEVDGDSKEGWITLESEDKDSAVPYIISEIEVNNPFWTE